MRKSVKIHLFMFLAIFVNCLFVFRFWVVQYSIARLFFLGFLSLASILILRNEIKHYQVNFFDVFFGTYVGINALSILWSTNQVSSLYGVSSIGVIFLLYLISKMLLETYQDQAIKASIILTSITAVFYIAYSFYGLNKIPDLLAYFGQPDLKIKNSTLYLIQKAIGIHKNAISSLLILSITFSLLGLLYFKNQWRYSLYGIIAFSITLVLIFQSRSAYLALFISVGIIFIMGLFIKGFLQKVFRPAPIGTIILAGGSFLLFTLSTGSLNSYIDRVLSSTNETTELLIPNDVPNDNNSNISDVEEISLEAKTINERFLFWSRSFDIIKAHPVLGVGLMNWAIHFQGGGYKGIERFPKDNRSPQHPHNDYLWIWSETGILGISSYLLMLGFLIFTGVKAYSQTPSDDLKLKITICLAGIIAYSLIVMFTGRKMMLDQQYLFFLLAALLLHYSKINTKKPILSIHKLAITGLIVSLSTAIILIAYIRFNGTKKGLKIHQLERKAKWTELIEYTKGNAPYLYNQRKLKPIDAYIAYAYDQIDLTDLSLEKYEKALEVNPNHYSTLSDYADVLLKTKDTNNALKRYVQALHIFSEYDPARIGYTKAFIETQNWKKARKNMKLIQDEEVRKELAKKIKKKRQSEE